MSSKQIKYCPKCGSSHLICAQTIWGNEVPIDELLCRVCKEYIMPDEVVKDNPLAREIEILLRSIRK